MQIAILAASIYTLLWVFNLLWGNIISVSLQSLIGAGLFVGLSLYVCTLDEESVEERAKMQMQIDELKEEITKLQKFWDLLIFRERVIKFSKEFWQAKIVFKKFFDQKSNVGWESNNLISCFFCLIFEQKFFHKINHCFDFLDNFRKISIDIFTNYLSGFFQLSTFPKFLKS